jgi:hypothetical protein
VVNRAKVAELPSTDAMKTLKACLCVLFVTLGELTCCRVFTSATATAAVQPCASTLLLLTSWLVHQAAQFWHEWQFLIQVLTTDPHVITLAGVAAAADPCGSLNFFPTASQITGLSGTAASVAVNDDVTCSGNQVCNWPNVVNRTAQEAYQTELGTSVAAGGLLSVAVKEYSGKQLRIFFLPVSPLLTANANAMSCVLAKTPTATRKLSQASTYAVTTPGTWSYSATLSSGGTLPGGSRAATATGDLTFSTEGAEDVSDGRPLPAPACSNCNAASGLPWCAGKCPARLSFACISMSDTCQHTGEQPSTVQHMRSLADKGCCCSAVLTTCRTRSTAPPSMLC